MLNNTNSILQNNWFIFLRVPNFMHVRLCPLSRCDRLSLKKKLPVGILYTVYYRIYIYTTLINERSKNKKKIISNSLIPEWLHKLVQLFFSKDNQLLSSRMSLSFTLASIHVYFVIVLLLSQCLPLYFTSVLLYLQYN